MRKPGWRNREIDIIRWISGCVDPLINLQASSINIIQYNIMIATRRNNAAPNTSSVKITVVRWYATTLHASYRRLFKSTIFGSISAAGIDIIHSKYAKKGG